MCYWLINETRKIVSKTSAEHVTRYDYLKPDIESRVNEFNKKLTEWLLDGTFQANLDVDGKFDLILLGQNITGNQGVNYESGVAPTDKKYDGMIVEEQPNDEDDVIDKYLNMNFIFDVRNNGEHCGTVIKH